MVPGRSSLSVLEKRFNSEQLKLSHETDIRKSNLMRQKSRINILAPIFLFITVIVLIIIFVFKACHYGLRFDSKRLSYSSSFIYSREEVLNSSIPFQHVHRFGAYSEYFTDDYCFPGIDKLAGKFPNRFPNTCSLEQVHTLHRHAERHPTVRVAESLVKFADKLKESVAVSRDLGDLEWLKFWNYTLDTDHLMPKGFETQFQSGRAYWEDYGKLLYRTNKTFYSNEFLHENYLSNQTKQIVPVIRATDQERIRDSAEAWASGFFGQSSDFAFSNDVSGLYTMVLQSESVGTNNTLSCGYSCPNFYRQTYFPGRMKNSEWVNTYLSNAVLRLQHSLPEFKNLTNGDVYHMQNICAFETAFYGDSKFCGLFTEEEWAGYEYAGDLIFYYGYSFGSRFGQARGAGWVTEFLARLKKEQITTAYNGVNVTLASNKETFPVNQLFYLDMSHDIDITSVLTTIGFHFLESNFSSSYMNPTRQFISSRLIPFGSRLNFEILRCETEKFIRVNINGRILPLASLGDCGEDSQGLCKYEDFIHGLQLRLDKADFDHVCYGPSEV